MDDRSGLGSGQRGATRTRTGHGAPADAARGLSEIRWRQISHLFHKISICIVCSSWLPAWCKLVSEYHMQHKIIPLQKSSSDLYTLSTRMCLSVFLCFLTEEKQKCWSVKNCDYFLHGYKSLKPGLKFFKHFVQKVCKSSGLWNKLSVREKTILYLMWEFCQCQKLWRHKLSKFPEARVPTALKDFVLNCASSFISVAFFTHGFFCKQADHFIIQRKRVIPFPFCFEVFRSQCSLSLTHSLFRSRSWPWPWADGAHPAVCVRLTTWTLWTSPGRS